MVRMVFVLLLLSHMMQLCPASLVLYPKLRPIAEQGYAGASVVTHDGCMVEWGEALGVSVVRRGAKRKENLGTQLLHMH